MAATQVRQSRAVGDVLSANQPYLKRVTALFAVVGLGLGLAVFFLGEFGSPLPEVSGENAPPTGSAPTARGSSRPRYSQFDD